MIKIIRKTDIALIGGFLVLAVALLFIFFAGGAAQGARIIIVHQGQEIYNLDLAEMEGQTFTVTTDFGVNVIHVEGGRVAMTHADCPDDVCVRMGWISSTFQRITCLPNRILVRLEAAPEQEDSDPQIDMMITF